MDEAVEKVLAVAADFTDQQMCQAAAALMSEVGINQSTVTVFGNNLATGDQEDFLRHLTAKLRR